MFAQLFKNFTGTVKEQKMADHAFCLIFKVSVFTESKSSADKSRDLWRKTPQGSNSALEKAC